MEALTVWTTRKITLPKFSVQTQERKKKENPQLNPILLGFYFSHSLETTACQPLKSDEKKAVDTRTDAADRNGCLRGKERKHHSHHRARRWDVYTESYLTGSLGNLRGGGGGCFWPSAGERDWKSRSQQQVLIVLFLYDSGFDSSGGD